MPLAECAAKRIAETARAAKSTVTVTVNGSALFRLGWFLFAVRSVVTTSISSRRESAQGICSVRLQEPRREHNKLNKNTMWHSCQT